MAVTNYTYTPPTVCLSLLTGFRITASGLHSSPPPESFGEVVTPMAAAGKDAIRVFVRVRPVMHDDEEVAWEYEDKSVKLKDNEDNEVGDAPGHRHTDR